MQEVLLGVLRLCHEAGLVRLGLVALDGTKVGANASLEANYPAGRIAERRSSKAHTRPPDALLCKHASALPGPHRAHQPFRNKHFGERQFAGRRSSRRSMNTPGILMLSFADLGGVGLQQDACLHQLACTVFAAMDQRVEPFTLRIVELHDVLLCGNLFRDHNSSPAFPGPSIQRPVAK
jgi:hypothetical protein